jgi:hypothetical protein
MLIEQLTLIVENKAEKERESNGPAIEAIQYPANVSAEDIILDKILRIRRRRHEAGIDRHCEALQMLLQVPLLSGRCRPHRKECCAEG